MSEITTVDQLEALPSRAVVRTADGDIWERLGTGWDCLSETGQGGGLEPSEAVMYATLLGRPVVIYRPDQPPRTEAHIKAEALREAAFKFQVNVWCDILSGPFETRIGNSQAVLDWLRARADQIESGERP